MFSSIIYRYPNPSKDTYEKRLLCPFEYALQSPNNQLPNNHGKHQDDSRQPQCFVIPGNHG